MIHPYTKVRVRWSVTTMEAKTKSSEAILVYMGDDEISGKVRLDDREEVGENGVVFYMEQPCHYGIPKQWITLMVPVPDWVPMEKPHKYDTTNINWMWRDLFAWLDGDLVRDPSPFGGSPWTVVFDPQERACLITAKELLVLRHKRHLIADTVLRAGWEWMLRENARNAALRCGITLKYRIDQAEHRNALKVHAYDEGAAATAECPECLRQLQEGEDMVYMPIPEVHDQAVAPTHPKCAENNGFETIRERVAQIASPRDGMCEWWLLCENFAEKTRVHPIFGHVPICKRCDDKAERLGA